VEVSVTIDGLKTNKAAGLNEELLPKSGYQRHIAGVVFNKRNRNSYNKLD